MTYTWRENPYYWKRLLKRLFFKHPKISVVIILLLTYVITVAVVSAGLPIELPYGWRGGGANFGRWGVRVI